MSNRIKRNSGSIFVKRIGNTFVDPNERVILTINEPAIFDRLIDENVEIAFDVRLRDRRGEIMRELARANQSVDQAIAHRSHVVGQLDELKDDQ